MMTREDFYAKTDEIIKLIREIKEDTKRRNEEFKRKYPAEYKAMMLKTQKKRAFETLEKLLVPSVQHLDLLRLRNVSE